MRAQVPELLSPAGNLETALAAFDAGADAVYCGLDKFNARERAGNFSVFDMGRLIRYARKLHKKVYLTFNTLVKEKELPEAFEYLAQIDTLAPDALIVQDLGIAALCREYFPSLALHASTQMGIHSSAGVAFAARFGMKRVILERQVTLAELQLIAKRSTLELEVFIHGSLCCSLSGRCLLSAAQGGFSGNRGKCKQPCRRKYESAQTSGWLLSPRDLFGMDLLPELRKIGIASLKIEGRLRSPDYVWKTARAYRLLLDGPLEPEAERLREAQMLLNAAASRRPSRGFYFPDRELIDYTRNGGFGTEVGKVSAVNKRGIKIQCSGRLHLGDRLRLVPPDGGEGESFSLIEMQGASKNLVKLLPGMSTFIPGQFNTVPGSSVVKIGENGFDYTRQAAALPPPGRSFDLELHLSAKHWSAKIPEIPDFAWEKATDFPPPEKNALAEADVRNAFSAGCPEQWILRKLKLVIDGEFFVPSSVLKSLRRECYLQLAAIPETALANPAAEAMMKFYQNYHHAVTVAPETPNDPAGIRLPDFCPEGDAAMRKARLKQQLAQGATQVTVGSLDALEWLQEYRQVSIHTVFPLPVTNSAAAEALRRYQVISAEAEPELSTAETEEIQAHTVLPIRPGNPNPPLLVTRAKLPCGKQFRDKRGQLWECQYDAESGLTRVYRVGTDSSLILML